MRTNIQKHESVYNPTNLVQIQGFDNERELSISTSTFNSDFDEIPRSVIDDLDEIYTYQRHKQCINLTYLTLLSMTCGVIFWILYWLTYDYCVHILLIDDRSSICYRTIFILELIIFISIGFSPILLFFMIIFWIRFSCVNPIDKIRNNFIGFRLEGKQWENQINYFNFYSNKTKKKLLDRNFGYIILSSHGIIFDQLFLLISSKHFLIHGILNNHRNVLKLVYKNYCQKQILIYLPDELIHQEILQEFMNILKIKIDF